MSPRYLYELFRVTEGEKLGELRALLAVAVASFVASLGSSLISATWHPPPPRPQHAIGSDRQRRRRRLPPKFVSGSGRRSGSSNRSQSQLVASSVLPLLPFTSSYV
eukprot:7660446-Pyramimonas_sp.AAC.1